MFDKSTRCLALIMFLSTLFFSSQAYSAGFQLFSELSARGTAMGGALTARDDIAETAWFNPAAVSMLDGFKFSTGTALVIPQMKLQQDDHEYGMKDKVYPVPHVYAALPFADKFGVPCR
jgi:long-chain fatty acid transport protein